MLLSRTAWSGVQGDGMEDQKEEEQEMSEAELIGSLELGNVWVFVQLIYRPRRTNNQLYNNQNIS